jgi:polysaccharide pyruvyl transferase CsaB
VKILISGYYGFGNEGDEWILEALIAALNPESHAITVLSVDPAGTQARHGVRSVPRWDMVSVVREISQCDFFISGGGGLIQDLSGPWTPAYYLALGLCARVLGKPVVLAGQGFGPITRGWNRKFCQWILPRLGFILARDPEGAQWCCRMGVPEARIHTGADWVWSLPVPKTRLGNDWAICLRADWLEQTPPSWLDEFMDLARKKQKRVRWVLLGNRGDSEVCAQWQKKYAQVDSAQVNLSGRTFAQAVSALAGIEWMISMRYHGLIAAASTGARVTGCGRDGKIQYLSAALKQPLAGTMGVEGIWKTHARALREQQVCMQQLRGLAADSVREFTGRISRQDH